jgi:hypothetical protein
VTSENLGINCPGTLATVVWRQSVHPTSFGNTSKKSLFFAKYIKLLNKSTVILFSEMLPTQGNSRSRFGTAPVDHLAGTLHVLFA